LGGMLLDFQMNGREWAPRGNRDDSIAPQGVYRCAGEDDWIAISCRDDQEWARLSEVIGMTDPRFADVIGRVRHHDELDALISAWTRDQDHLALMHRLQQAGVPAAAVLNHKELLENEHLHARGYFEEVDHPEAGRHVYHGMTWKLSGTPGSIRFHAPL